MRDSPPSLSNLIIMRGINRFQWLIRKSTSYGAEYKNLLRLGLPVMITQLGIIVVSFADTIMVAHCGTRELGAAAFVNSIFMVAIVMLFGFAAGLTPLIGALFSRGDSRSLGAMMKAGVIANLAMAIIFTAILGCLYFFVGHMGQSEELLPLVRPYFLIVLATLLPLALFNALQQTSNGCTDTATPMWLILGSNALNIFGNWLLIGGNWGFPALGLSGAGLSTLISRIVAAIGIVIVFLVDKKRRAYLEGWKSADRQLTKANCRQVWKTSSPVMVQSGIECFMWSFGGVVSGWFGTIQLASYQVVNTIAQLGFMVYMGFGVATSIRVANFWGVKEYQSARRITMAGLHLILLLAVIACLGFGFFFRPLLEIFTPDPIVEAAAFPLLLPLILYQLGDAVQLTYANALRGTSHVKPLLKAAVISYIIIGIPLMLLLAVGFNMGNVGVYYSFIVALMAAALIMYVSFRKVLRRHLHPEDSEEKKEE